MYSPLWKITHQNPVGFVYSPLWKIIVFGGRSENSGKINETYNILNGDDHTLSIEPDHVHFAGITEIADKFPSFTVEDHKHVGIFHGTVGDQISRIQPLRELNLRAHVVFVLQGGVALAVQRENEKASLGRGQDGVADRVEFAASDFRGVSDRDRVGFPARLGHGLFFQCRK